MTSLLKILFLVLAALTTLFTGAMLADAAEPVSGIVRTSDGIPISYDYYKEGFDSVIIVCPGFFNSKENKWMRKTVDMLTPGFDVMIFDFRGHGESGGRYTWSVNEKADVDAMVNYARSLGYKKIGILAFSLGATAAVNDAATRSDINSMVLVSCPSTFQHIDFHFWESSMWADLMDNIYSKGKGKGVRPGSILLAKEDPINTIGKIKGSSIMLISGDKDWIIKSRHSVQLYDAVTGYKRIEIIKDGFHAERLIEFQYETMRSLIIDWFSKTLLIGE